jgi:hypothetical protein
MLTTGTIRERKLFAVLKQLSNEPNKGLSLVPEIRNFPEAVKLDTKRESLGL